MYKYYLLHKPFQVLTQFSPEGDKQTLADILPHISKDIYPVGRLDYDSEGLLLLTNDKSLTHRLLHPKFAHERTYHVQVEGMISDDAIAQLQKGVTINVNGKTHDTLPAKAKKLPDNINVSERNPPIRFRKNIPTSWLSLTLTEGKNRQVRKMTAAVGFPTLRLIRYAIGKVTLNDLQPGQYIEISSGQVKEMF